MKLLIIIIGALGTFAVLQGIDGVSIENIDLDRSSLEKQTIDFLKPYTPYIRQWFWDLSGVSVPARFQTIQPQADFITCDVCTLALPFLKLFIRLNVTSETIIQVITFACEQLHLAPRDDICLPTIRSYAAPIIYIVQNKPDIPNSDFCGILNPGCNGVALSPDLSDWTINVDTNKPQVIPRPAVPANATSTKILQFTDIHLDMDYAVGTNSDCGLPICCRETDGPPNETEPAGEFGHFNCGLPEAGLQAMFDHAKQNHQDARFIFLTGDYVHSGVWLYSQAENGRHIRRVTSMLSTTFADTGMEIYPLTGNHEPDVVNMYPPMAAWDEFPLGWMYEAVVEPFAQFLPQQQLELFKKYGYYTVTPKNDPNLRIIALNTNLCYINNFWLPFDAVDTFGQLQWFANTLDEAEKSNQHVLVIGHIQPGSGSCWPVWSNQFNRIINRYESIIRGQFYGHSHEQYYTLAFEYGTERPISLSFVGGSGLTDGMNSAYNVYEVDGERGVESTWEIMNQQTFALNLTESNRQKEAVFEQILDARTMYGISSMTPETIYEFVYRMVCDDTLFVKYQQVSVKGHDSPRLHLCGNDKRCRASVLSDLFVSNSADHTREQLMQEFILNVNCNIPTTTQPPTGATGSSEGTDEQNDNGSNSLQSSTAFIIAIILFNI